MARRLITLLLGLVLSGGAVATAAAQAPTTRTPPATNTQKEAGEAVIVMARGADYFEISPVYRVWIYADGRVVYLGTKNVKTKGLAEGRISPENLQRLVKAFEDIDYFSLLDEYSRKGGCPVYMVDGPSAHTFVRIGDRKKSIFHDSGCMEDRKVVMANKVVMASFPPGLTELEYLIDEIVKSEQWTK